jgi:hypothetical protein
VIGVIFYATHAVWEVYSAVLFKAIVHCKRSDYKKYFYEANNTLQSTHCSIIKIFTKKAQEKKK